MSLILEALKKLEREKQTPDRGFLVVAHVPWPAGPAGRSLWLGVAATLGLVGLLAFVLLRGRESRPAAVTAQPVATLPVASAPPAAPPAFPSPAPPATQPAASLGAPVTRAAPSSPTPSPPSELELRLNAITQQDGRPVAVLNDRVVREGDVFDGIHVIRIGEAEVEVEVNGKRRVVRF